MLHGAVGDVDEGRVDLGDLARIGVEPDLESLRRVFPELLWSALRRGNGASSWLQSLAVGLSNVGDGRNRTLALFFANGRSNFGT